MKVNRSFFDLNSPFIVAVDGDAASGKGTFCRKLANEYNLFYCQTSIFYRKLAKIAIDMGVTDTADLVELTKQKDFGLVQNKDIYSEDVSKKASIIASIGEVREAINLPQRKLLLQHKRIIMEGRDIGTVIAPNADFKLYFTADVDIRSKRRFVELLEKDPNITFEVVKNNIMERDNMDKKRKNAPLSIAADAVVIDSSKLDADQVYGKVLEFLRRNYSHLV